MNRCTLIAFVLCSLLAGNVFVAASEDDSATASSAKLHAIFEREWAWSMQTYPTWASSLGDMRYNTEWTDQSLDAHSKRHQHRREVHSLAHLENL